MSQSNVVSAFVSDGCRFFTQIFFFSQKSFINKSWEPWKTVFNLSMRHCGISDIAFLFKETQSFRDLTIVELRRTGVRGCTVRVEAHIPIGGVLRITAVNSGFKVMNNSVVGIAGIDRK